MADGLARATGEVGVVLVSRDQGRPMRLLALPPLIWIPSISCPFRAGSDLVDRLRCLSECDMVGISRPVVKHSFLVKQRKTFRRC